MVRQYLPQSLRLASLTAINSALHLRELIGVRSIIFPGPWRRLVLQERSASLHVPVTLNLLLPVHCISIRGLHSQLYFMIISYFYLNNDFPLVIPNLSHLPPTPIPGPQRGKSRAV